jgi:hypothetical protein
MDGRAGRDSCGVRNVEGISVNAAVRERLPNRRAAETFDVEVGGLRYRATIGRYPDGRIGEIFITNHKAGSEAGIMVSDAAVAASLALQYGTPIETLRHALMRDVWGRPSGPLGVVLDQIAKEEG